MDIHGFGMMVLDRLPFEPTDQQIALVAALARFCSAGAPSDSVFILNGYAGTGKTSVTGALVQSLNALNRPTVLMASTGRAAKVLSNFTGRAAHTIHRTIYRAPMLLPDGRWSSRLAENKYANAVFIVDEASMIGDAPADGGADLLHDLIFYVYSGINCRLILIGDTAQLPPVGLEDSPAMNPDTFKRMDMHVTRATMTKTVRQQRQSGILYNATALRRALRANRLGEPHLRISGFDDVTVATPEELEDALQTSFAMYGERETLLITRSNRRAKDFNMAIRRIIYDREELLVPGERILVAKNNYYWTRRSVVEASGGDINGDTPRKRPMDFIANGEGAVVERVFATETHGDVLYADVRLFFPDYDWRVDAKICLDALTSDTATLPADKRELIYRQALADAGVAETASSTAIQTALKADPYYNALQIKYGYAVTCHKAQGGQWKSVFVDMGYIPPEAYSTTDFYRWLYTAVTRATTRLQLVNPMVRIV